MKISNRMMGICIGAVLLLSAACSKNNSGPSGPGGYTIPTTYSFSNVDSIPAKSYLSMLNDMVNYINTANTPGTVLSSTKLQLMFANNGGNFSDTVFSGITVDLNSSNLHLKDATSQDAQALITSIIDSSVQDSQSGQTASNGVPGVSPSNTLLGADGIYWKQFFTKVMMGAFIAHQVQDVYLGDSLTSPLNGILAKRHAWDQAFFLWCVPSNFPANRTGVKFWGSYTSQIDSGIARPVVSLTGINANTTLLNAFLKGRAALGNNDSATAVQQANIIIPFFEIMEAAAASHELNEAKGNLANGPAAVCGNLSESLGFWTALKFNTHKQISDADYQAVLSLYGTNFYNATPASIQAIQDKISSIYGWDVIKLNM